VRPPDENQHGSTRPNLLSGARRHDGEDDNILERLERDSARHASGNRNRAAWYAASASLMLLLIVVLAWMAYENANTVQVIPMTRVPANSGAATGAVPADPGKRLVPDPAPAPGLPANPPVLPPAARDPVTPAPLRDATTIAATDQPAVVVPPLVLLQSHEAVPNKPSVAKAPEPSVSATVPEPAAPAVAAPVKPAVRTSVPAAPSAVNARVGARAVAAARPRKAGSANLTAESLVDTDVALLSAIIIHDSSHAEEKALLEAAATCGRAIARKCSANASANQ
jgi:hypothetical protein